MWRIVIVPRYAPAGDDPAVNFKCRESALKRFASDVVEIDVYPIRRLHLQLFGDGTYFVVECDIKAALFP